MRSKFIHQIFATSAITLCLTTSINTKQAPSVPSLDVPACPQKAHIKYDKSVPNLSPFPLTAVDLCYSDSSLELDFTAYNETNFFYDPKQRTNDDLFKYEVMEAFIYRGTDDPQTYLEIEISPANVTYQSFIYNPSKTSASGAPFDNILIPRSANDGFKASTTLNKPAQSWTSQFTVPLGIFNVDNHSAKGTQWRMNFFRTVTNSTFFPNQILGAWSPPDEPHFHTTSYFGHVKFV